MISSRGMSSQATSMSGAIGCLIATVEILWFLEALEQ